MTAPWVHASVPSGCEEFKEHAGFIQNSAMAGMVGLSLIPAALVIKEHITSIDALTFTLLAAPLAVAAFVSRSGALETGKRATLLYIALLIAVLIGSTGFVQSPFAVLICVLPVEAILWRCRAPYRLTILLVAACLAGAYATASIVAASPASVSLASLSGASVWLAVLALAYAATVAIRLNRTIKRVESHLDREARHVDLFTRHSGELITRHAADGSTLFASPAARDVLGVAAKELLEAGLLNRVHIQDRVVLLKALSDAVQHGTDQMQRIRIRAAAGEGRLWKLAEIRCRADRDGQSGKTGAICIMRDVSELHQMEEDLQDARNSADKFNDAQRHFLATMSHELRTPLNAIVGFSDILRQELFGRLPHQKHREYVTLIQDSGQHLLNVVNDMLDMSRIEAGKYELSVCSFDMADIAEATVSMLQPMATKGGVQVSCHVDRALPEISADKRACQQVLINLLSNAIKFTPEGGNVSLTAKQFGRSLRVRVKDDGIGIKKEFLEKVGQPFTQEDSGHQRKFEGSGIGLSVVKGLVDLHNGEFDIKSKEGAGTVVTITLPVAPVTSKPVPTDHTSQLVHLKPNRATPIPSPVTAPVSSKGERRARVSA